MIEDITKNDKNEERFRSFNLAFVLGFLTLQDKLHSFYLSSQIALRLDKVLLYTVTDRDIVQLVPDSC